MDRLSSCYFCGIALDEPLQDYPLRGADGEPGAVVTLCPGCHRKVETVLEVLLSGEESEVDLPALDAADRPELEGGPDRILTEPDTQEQPPSDGPGSAEEPIAMGSGREGRAAGGADEPAGGDEETGSERGIADLFETPPEGEGGVADADSGIADADGTVPETDEPTNPGEQAADGTAVGTDSAASGGAEHEAAPDAGESEAEPGKAEPGGDGSADDAGDGGDREGGRELVEGESEAESAPEDGVESEDRVGSEPAGVTDGEPQAGSGNDVMPGPNGEESRNTESRSGGKSGGGRGGEDGSGVRVSALEYNKVMRLLQNREFPVDREEIVAVAANAYELSEAECRSVIDLAVDRGLLAERGDSLVRPED